MCFWFLHPIGTKSIDSKTSTKTQPWKNESDTAENNARAKKAYTALLYVTPKQTFDEAYANFTEKLIDLAKSKYNYSFPTNQPISTFVTAFYDAVLLYAYALNDTIKNDLNSLYNPINGTQLIRLMWGRKFNGITGEVNIDQNGDRISDYCLLDMDPESGFFEIVANYYNHSRLEFVENKTIHWAGDRSQPPRDVPECGFDNSLCPCKFFCF